MPGAGEVWRGMAMKKDAGPIDVVLLKLEAEEPPSQIRSEMRLSIQQSLPRIRKLVARGYTVAEIARRIADSRGDKYETVRAYLHEALGPVKRDAHPVHTTSCKPRRRSLAPDAATAAAQDSASNGSGVASAESRTVASHEPVTSDDDTHRRPSSDTHLRILPTDKL
jgi:hypothetical protein